MSTNIEEYLYPTDRRLRRPVSLASDVRKEAIRLNILEESYKIKHGKQIEREMRYFTNDITHRQNMYSKKFEKLQRRKTEIQEERREKERERWNTGAQYINRQTRLPSLKLSNHGDSLGQPNRNPGNIGLQLDKMTMDSPRSDIICTFSVQGEEEKPFVINPFVKTPHHLEKINHKDIRTPNQRLRQVKVYRVGKHKNLIKDNDMLKLLRSKTLASNTKHSDWRNVKRTSTTRISEKPAAYVERLESIDETIRPARKLPRSLSDPTHNAAFFGQDQFKARPEVTLSRSISSQSDGTRPSRRVSMVYNSLPIYFRSSTTVEQANVRNDAIPSGMDRFGARQHQEKIRRRSTGSSALTVHELIQQEPYRKVSIWQNFVHPK